MIDKLVPFNHEEFDLNKPYLWVWNPEGIPPHMGFSSQGGYFSLKVNGLDFNSNLKDIIGIIQRKKLPVLAIEVGLNISLDDCKTVFSKFDRTIAHEVTCLNPIKSVLDVSSPSKLSELLEVMNSQKMILGKTTWNINKGFIELANYSTEDIHKHLVALSK